MKKTTAWLTTTLALAFVVSLLASAGPAVGAHASAASAPAVVHSYVLRHLLTGGQATRAGATRVAKAGAPCKTGSAVLCSTVTVPLDRTGQVAGTIGLHVEVLPAEGVPRGAMFLIAGGPGQGSAHVFGLTSAANAAFYRFMFPGYTLVAYDDRGTGDSGLLDCPALQSSFSSNGQAQLVADCAAQLGANRAFYSTADHVEDLEAVRQSIGVDKVGLWGTSYGTKLAMAYALAHPDHVERLVLDSVLPPEQPDPFSASVLTAMSNTLTGFCSDGGCKATTPDFAGDVVAVANQLAAKPIQGKVTLGSGGSRTLSLGGIDFLSMVLDADLNPGLAAELPAVVHAARRGTTQPLLRTYLLDAGSASETAIDLSDALFAATVCHDGPFPWQPDTPIADRPALVQAAIAALPAGALGPFGSWAAGFGNASFCVDWPSPSGGVALGAGPLPNVPVLALSGGFDMRTPTAGAVAIASRFPQGHVLVVPGVGHSVLGADITGCSQRATRAWILSGTTPPASCPRGEAIVTPIAALPARPKGVATPAATLAIVSKTLHEAQAAWLMTAGLSGGAVTLPGIYGGRLVATSARSFRLVAYSLDPGITVSGTLKLKTFGPPLVFQGAVTVAGKAASDGILGLKGASLRGTLGGRIFR